MRDKRHRSITGAVAAALLFAPLLLSGGERPADAQMIKAPETLTAAPEAREHRLTPIEEQKRLQGREPLRRLSRARPEPRVVTTSTGDYPGMTPAELEKLGHSPPASAHARAGAKHKDVSTIHTVPRPAGIGALTPAERAKLEAVKRIEP